MTTTTPFPRDGDDIALLMGKPSVPDIDPALIAWGITDLLAEKEVNEAEIRRLRLQLRNERIATATAHRAERRVGALLDAVLEHVNEPFVYTRHIPALHPDARPKEH